MSDATEAILNYSTFIEELNRFGRLFHRLGYDLPRYYEIRFYRNKSIEHWDEYEEFLRAPGNGIIFAAGKLATPYYVGAINVPMESESALDQVKEEFAKLG